MNVDVMTALPVGPAEPTAAEKTKPNGGGDSTASFPSVLSLVSGNDSAPLPAAETKQAKPESDAATTTSADAAAVLAALLAALVVPDMAEHQDAPAADAGSGAVPGSVPSKAQVATDSPASSA